MPREVRRDSDGGGAPVGCCEMHVLRILQRRDQRERRVHIVQVKYRLVLAGLRDLSNDGSALGNDVAGV